MASCPTHPKSYNRSAMPGIGCAPNGPKTSRHLDIDLRYREVTPALSTDSAGSLAEQDFALATKIEALVASGA